VRPAVPRVTRSAVRIQAFKEDDKPSDAASKAQTKVQDTASDTQANVQDAASKVQTNMQDAASKAQTKLQDITPQLGEAERVIGQGGMPSYDPEATRVFGLPAFTRRREVFAGRLAMFGFAAAYIGEILTGQGIIGQLQLWTGWSEKGVLLALGTLVGLNFIGAIWPNGPTFSEENQRDVHRRPAGPVQEVMDPFTEPKQFGGVSGFGFTKANELFHGRLAMLGFAGAVLVEAYRHQGVIAQAFGLLDNPIDYSVATWGLAAWAVLWTIIAYASGKPGELHGGKDMF
jgi:hypothetical protein